METNTHNKGNKFECEVCKMTFPTKEEYEKHMRENHNQ
ncbi:Zinc finger domain-containing protein, C2H2 type [Methanolobus vulcani]|jgi:uncharacterized C2H2 Zn-finger protein|uniref:Zinc finger domain-containing protein, C2H2 type n=1 Tax=Methanolobus vulcani TaxID=38026 RepID=A0A7Z7FD59_9EURY|nr:hypothetical protein [Methanolobus sp.]MDK2948387.1 hypothetical protein [Methanolobus sp.]SDG09211.1 Zinc finger domain-containing protein, C2H2 type [Methanolobus vulcani]